MNKNDLEKRINDLMISDCNINDVIEDIEDAKECEQTCAYHWLSDIEEIEINVTTLELNDLSKFNYEEIKKAYAIKEYNQKLTLNDICDNLLDKFYYYENLEEYKEIYLDGNCWDDDMTEDNKMECVNKSIENLIKTSWGYLEED